jgi:hypothetical protein
MVEAETDSIGIKRERVGDIPEIAVYREPATLIDEVIQQSEGVAHRKEHRLEGIHPAHVGEPLVQRLDRDWARPNIVAPPVREADLHRNGEVRFPIPMTDESHLSRGRHAALPD